jgi:hypothetical protein
MRKPKASDRSEWWVKKQVKLILKDTGWESWMPNSGMFGRVGVSDFLAVKKPALFMAIETKYDDVPTQLQLAFLKMIHDAGHYAFLVDETNVDQLRALLTNDHDLSSYPVGTLRKWQENLTNT